MTREQLAHILRAAATIVQDREILVIGSQSILGTYSEDQLPPEASASIEADVAFLHDEDASKADMVEGAIGELSMFHETFGIYAQGVEVSTATLPSGWRDRVVEFPDRSAWPSTALCLDPHDLVVSKLVAGREKDLRFARALIEAELIEPDVLQERVLEMDDLDIGSMMVRRIRGLEGPSQGRFLDF